MVLLAVAGRIARIVVSSVPASAMVGFVGNGSIVGSGRLDVGSGWYRSSSVDVVGVLSSSSGEGHSNTV
jgi:hypothetical protein